MTSGSDFLKLLDMGKDRSTSASRKSMRRSIGFAATFKRLQASGQRCDLPGEFWIFGQLVLELLVLPRLESPENVTKQMFVGGTAHGVSLWLACHISFSFKIAACRRLFTVPTGTSSDSAASRYLRPW